MRIVQFYYFFLGLALFITGLILFSLALRLHRWLRIHRANSASRWVWLTLIIDVPGEVLEVLGLFLALMAISNNLALGFGVSIEKQFMLTTLLVIIPVLLAIFIVSLLSRWLRRKILSRENMG